MKLDVIVIAYNHSQFIDQALDSMCQQLVPSGCSVRVLAADDCSKDDTLAKILAHKEQIESRGWNFEQLQSGSNLGISRNYQRAFAACDGDYVAILEGDDYWLTENHLLQHLSFLEQHPECSMSMNRITNQWGTNPELKPATWYKDKRPFQMISLQQQIEWGNQLGNLSACMFRTHCLKNIPPPAYTVHLDDFLIGIYMAEQGLLGLLKDSTSVYRGNENSLWARKSALRQFIDNVKFGMTYDKLMNGKYHDYWNMYFRKITRRERMRFIHKLKLLLLCEFSHR